MPAPEKPAITIEDIVVTASMIFFSWTASPSVTTSEVNWTPTGRQSADGGTSGKIMENSYTIKNLRGSTSYEITVTVSNAAGSSSTTFTYSTTEGWLLCFYTTTLLINHQHAWATSVIHYLVYLKAAYEKKN